MSNCVKEAEGSPDETSFTAKDERGAGDWGLGTGDWGLGTGDLNRKLPLRVVTERPAEKCSIPPETTAFLYC
ncbi:hypothetical protein [Nostoc sp.]|uniref:hypothetical protein n=1 Tax=Nostoc sp. TaxID=1180 RepID=UPI002FFB7E39